MYLEDYGTMLAETASNDLFVWRLEQLTMVRPNLLRHLHSSVPALVLTVLLAAIEQQS